MFAGFSTENGWLQGLKPVAPISHPKVRIQVEITPPLRFSFVPPTVIGIFTRSSILLE